LEYEYGTPTYYLHIVENRETRALEFRSRKGTILYTLTAPQGYFPFDQLATIYPGLYSGRFSSEVVSEYEAMYDPARVEIVVRLIPSDPEYVEPYLYGKAKVREYEWAARLAAEDDEQGGMMMLMGGPEELRITSVSVLTNGILLELSFPEGFTNEVHIFKTQHLVAGVWELAATGLHPDGTNNMTWLYTGTEDFAALTFADGIRDTDEDGWPDSHEFFLYKTDPEDDASHPVTLEGDIWYDGIETGTIYVLMIPEEHDNWSMARFIALQGPGPYTSRPVANNASYYVRAFRDVDQSGSFSDWEPAGEFVMPLYLTESVTNVSFGIADKASVWGALDYSGSATGDIYVVAVSLLHWDKTYSTHIPWVQAYGSLTGDPVYVSFPVEYSIHGMPAGEYLIRAWIDEDGNEQYTHLEEAGQYAVDSIPVSNRVTGIDFTIALDTDDDGLPDWWEMQHFGGGTNAVASADPDGDGLTNLQEYQYGTNPNQWDTDGDGLSDYEEIFLTGTDPLNPQDGKDMLSSARQQVIANWNAVYATPLTFNNPPGSPADMQDFRNAFLSLSGIFHTTEPQEP
jgi:hypothetical protein